MQSTKAFSYLGFAIKSRKVVFGTDSIVEYKKKMYLIVVSELLAQNAQDKIVRRAEQHQIKVKVLADSEFTQLVPKNGCKAIAITSAELAKALLGELE